MEVTKKLLKNEKVDSYIYKFALKSDLFDIGSDLLLAYLGTKIVSVFEKLKKADIVAKGFLGKDIIETFKGQLTSKERVQIAAAYREMERAKIASKEAYKDYEYLYGITNRSLNSMSSSQDYRTMKIDQDLFQKKYPNGNLKQAERILQRYLHYSNSYTSIIGKTNLYVIPGTRTSRNNGGK